MVVFDVNWAPSWVMMVSASIVLEWRESREVHWTSSAVTVTVVIAPMGG